jgi:hypothetical protein
MKGPPVARLDERSDTRTSVAGFDRLIEAAAAAACAP